MLATQHKHNTTNDGSLKRVGICCPSDSVYLYSSRGRSSLPSPREMLNTPKGFAIVEPRLFRSSAFSREHFSFVRQLHLRTVLYLSSEEAPKAITDFCNDEEITFVNLGTLQPYSRAGEWSPLRGDLAKVALEALLDNSKLPLMIVCLNGVHQTSALVGCLRKLQCWSFTSIVEEHRRFCEVSSRSPIEHFIEIFDTDIVTLPVSLPEWFLDDLEAFKQEEAEERRKRSERNSSGSKGQTVDSKSKIGT